MKKHLLFLTVVAAVLLTVLSACSKDDDPVPGENRTELLIKSTWKFQKAEAGIIGDISSQLEDCIKDNTLTFVSASTTSTSGTGTLNEAAIKCDPADPQTRNFDWELRENGTVLHSSQVLFTGGSQDFNVVSVNDNNLVLSQQMTLDGFPATTVTVTLKH